MDFVVGCVDAELLFEVDQLVVEMFAFVGGDVDAVEAPIDLNSFAGSDVFLRCLGDDFGCQEVERAELVVAAPHVPRAAVRHAGDRRDVIEVWNGRASCGTDHATALKLRRCGRGHGCWSAECCESVKGCGDGSLSGILSRRWETDDVASRQATRRTR